MIITRTPFRVSFAGGGSDLPSYYRKHGAAVVSTTIDKYMYVAVNKRFDDSIRISYSDTEIVERVDDLKHEIVRAALRKTGIDRNVEISTIADISRNGPWLLLDPYRGSVARAACVRRPVQRGGAPGT